MGDFSESHDKVILSMAEQYGGKQQREADVVALRAYADATNNALNESAKAGIALAAAYLSEQPLWQSPRSVPAPEGATDV